MDYSYFKTQRMYKMIIGLDGDDNVDQVLLGVTMPACYM